MAKAAEEEAYARSTHKLPHSMEAEQAVLGSVLLDNRAWDQLQILDLVREQDFFLHAHRLIFQGIERCAGRDIAVDPVTVSRELENMGMREAAGDSAYLIELAENTPSAANVVHYARIVRSCADCRHLVDFGKRTVRDAVAPGDLDSSELIDRVDAELREIRDRHPARLYDSQSLLQSTMEHLEHTAASPGELTGLDSGFRDINDFTSGLQKGELIIIAGATGSGKTTLALNIAEHALLAQKKPVLMFSLEMGGGALMKRMLASLGNIPADRLQWGRLDDKTRKQLEEACDKLRPTALHVNDSHSLTPEQVRALCRQVRGTRGEDPALVVVDYLQLLHSGQKNENRTQEVTAISHGLKGIAREFDCPLIAISQLSRNKQNTAPGPRLEDLRESGSIEQDADLVLLIHAKSEGEGDGDGKKSGDDSARVVKLQVAKNRNGPTGFRELLFQGRFNRFRSKAPEKDSQSLSAADFSIDPADEGY